MRKSQLFSTLFNLLLYATGLVAQNAGVYTGGDKSGCGKSPLLPSLFVPQIVQSSGKARTYHIHLPANYDNKKQYPLIVGFHGSSSVGLFLDADTKLSDPKYTGDKIIVYPNGEGGNWAGASYAKVSVKEDLQFVSDMLTQLRKNYCIDSARIYATGMSNGGGFVGVLACNDTVGGEFAAFAPVSGAFYTDRNGPDNGCTPARDLTPMLEFHGGADQSVYYGGGKGEGGQLPSITNWLVSWAIRNNCTAFPNVLDGFNHDVHYFNWTCRGTTGVVQHYKTDDQKHDWPSTEINFSQLAAGDKPTHINANPLIIEFFNKFTRPA